MSRSVESNGNDGGTLGQVGRYALRSALASGGMASVYLAHLQGPHGFEKSVAVKRIHPHLVRDRRFVDMFLDEARVAARIHHPNVCAVMDFGEEGGAPYLVMEYLNGESLSSVLRVAHAADGCPLWLGARIVHDAARGLHAAHELTGPDGSPMGVVHRDVSPQNIFVLYDGVTKVVDFGVARARGRMSITRTNEVKGKIAYMAPEQYENDNVDHRADLWALGVVLWEATTGHRLFRGDNEAATLARVLVKPIPKPSSVVVGYPTRLEAIVMKCLERDLELRYASGDALADDLEAFLHSMAMPAGTQQAKKWMVQHFAAQIAYRQRLLRGEVVDDPPPQEPSGSTLSSIRSRTDPDDLTSAREPEAPTTAHRSSGRVSSRPPAASPDSLVPALPPPPRVPAVWPAPGAPEPRPPRPRRRYVSRGELAVIAIALVAIVLLVARRPSEPEAEIIARPIAPSSPAAPAPLVAEEPAPPVPIVPIQEVAPTVAEEHGPARPRTVRRAPYGTLSLLAIPAATVRENGRVLGETPLSHQPLSVGTHRLSLRAADGRTKTITVRIQTGQHRRMRVEL